MSTISFGGLASGLDTNAIINGLLGVEKVPLTNLRARQTEVINAQNQITGLVTRLSALKSSAQALSTPQGFSAYKATSSDPALVATVTGVASSGSYSIQVGALAREERRYSAGQTSGTDALGLAGSLSLQVGAGTTANLTVDANDSLTSIASKINGAGLRASASVVYDGSSYYLQVRGLDTGASNALTVSESGFSLGLNAPGAVRQSAQNAQITLDGITISRSTNQLTGVIPGVTLALTKTTTSPAELGISSDPESLKSKINNFVTAYNEAVSASKNAAGYGTLKASNQLLSGDTAIRSALDRVSRSLTQPVAGATGKYVTLGSVGVQVNRDGSLRFDDSKFSQALQSDPAGVAKIFVTDSTTGAVGAFTPLINAIDQAALNSNSTLKSRESALDALNTSLEKNAAILERRLTAVEDQLRSRFTQLESMITKIRAQGNGLSSLSAPQTTAR
jgi:flagellar hook-associated protein 2